MLVKHLPPESWTQTKLRDLDIAELVAEEPGDRTFGPWSQADYLSAALVDAVNRNTYVTALLAGAKDFPAPEPLPRPGLRPAGSRAPTELQRAQVIYLDSIRAKG